MRGIAAILILWLVFTTSCDPCENCGEPLLFEPTVALIFINNDTLGKLTSELGLITDSLERSEDRESNAADQLDSMEARLIVVNDSIDNGNASYEAERDQLEDLIGIYIDSLGYYTELIGNIDSVYDYLIDQRRDVSNGLLKVDTLFINGQYLTYDDSIETYDAPLLMNEESFTQFEVVIGDFRGEIAFDYELRESVDATREIKLRAYDIFPTDFFGFDSLEGPSCVTPQCRDNETTVYLYFQ